MTLHQPKQFIYSLAILPLFLSLTSYAMVMATSQPITEAPADRLVAPSQNLAATTITTLDWIDLLPENINRAALMEHYADLVIQHLDPPDDPSLLAQMMAKFDQAPTNSSLHTVKIRLAGYMIVLDDREGRITEFILVPYSGAGIHQPAPPANQMILVRVKPEQALAADQAYESVWVEGVLQVKTNPTSIASVAYLLEDAQVRLYTAEDAKQAATQHHEDDPAEGHDPAE